VQTAMDIWVYMLECSDGSYYIGLTRAGLEKRISEHHAGVYRGYTHSRLPVRLVWSQDFQRLTDAIACERQLKGWRREKKQALIRGDGAALQILARTARTRQPSAGSVSESGVALALRPAQGEGEL
jgi:putative endonuclease